MGTEADPEDRQAVLAVLAGDREAFGVLVLRHGRRVHDLARRLLHDAGEAEDAAQQAFLNAFRALARYDPNRPFGPWILRIVANLCKNAWAAGRRRPRAFGSAPEGEGDPRVEAVAAPPAECDGADADGSASVRAALESLPPLYRATAVLRYVHGLDLDAIAEVTGDPLGTVKTHLHRARSALRHALLRGEDDESRHAADGTEG